MMTEQVGWLKNLLKSPNFEHKNLKTVEIWWVGGHKIMLKMQGLWEARARERVLAAGRC